MPGLFTGFALQLASGRHHQHYSPPAPTFSKGTTRTVSLLAAEKRRCLARTPMATGRYPHNPALVAESCRNGRDVATTGPPGTSSHIGPCCSPTGRRKRLTMGHQWTVCGPHRDSLGGRKERSANNNTCFLNNTRTTLWPRRLPTPALPLD